MIGESGNLVKCRSRHRLALNGVFMKSQPLALALAFICMGMLILFYFVASWATENRRQEFAAIMESNKDISKMLFNCVPVDKQGSRPDNP